MRRPANRFLLLASCLVGFSLPARAVIDKIDQPLCRDRRPTETIQMRHHPNLNHLWIYGFGVDLAQRVTVSGIAGVRASLGRRQGGLGSHVEVRFTIPPDVQDGAEGRVTLHYPLGEDSFRIRVFSRPQLASITTDAPPPGPVFLLQRRSEYTITARGRNLRGLEFRPTEEMRRRASYRIESQDGSQMRIRFRALQPGRVDVSVTQFNYSGPECIAFGVVRLPSLDGQIQLHIRE
jgi:hypothetical protein